MKSHTLVINLVRNLIGILCLLLCLAAPLSVQAAVSSQDKLRSTYSGADGYVEASFTNADEEGVIKQQKGWGFYLEYSIVNQTGSELEFKITSSDSTIAEVGTYWMDTLTDGSKGITISSAQQEYHGSFYVNARSEGSAVITMTNGKVTCEIPILVFPYSTPYVQNAKQTDFHGAEVTFSCYDKSYDGYIIYRRKKNKNSTKIEVAIIKDKKATTASVNIPSWNVEYEFAVDGYIEYAGRRYVNSSDLYWGASIKGIDTGAKMKSVTQKGTSSLKITWEPVKDAKYYVLYVAQQDENAKYKKLCKTANADQTSYVHKVNAGTTYYYYVRVYFGSGDVSTRSTKLSGYIPKKNLTSATSTRQNVTDTYNSFRQGQYSGNWAVSDTIYYYTLSKKNYAVMLQKGTGNPKLVIYQIKDDMKMSKKRTIKLENFDVWGGFFKGPDNCFYVAYGYNNLQENDKKTVVKVVKYNKNWKKQKTAAIKGSAGNMFKGIYIPFRAGNCSMTMKGRTLYLAMAREMYATSDGLHHQSNISFEIDTKTMKAKEANDNYTSHSFNQFVRFKDNDLYQVDHGDAYPRSIALTSVSDFRTDMQATSTYDDVFQFQGETGANYTGAQVGGTEVGSKHVLICGTSVPHNHKVKGVKGSGYDLKENVYLITVDRKTGKKKFQWITQYHPRNSKVTLSEARMVKLSDSRFAILYSTTENGNSVLHYYVVNDSGKKVYKKNYKNITFTASSQPILSKGYIIWVESGYEYTSGYNYKQVTRTVRIPAKF